MIPIESDGTFSFVVTFEIRTWAVIKLVKLRLHAKVNTYQLVALSPFVVWVKERIELDQWVASLKSALAVGF